MRFAVPVMLKFLVILFVLGIFLWMSGMSFMNILLISLVTTALSLIGDFFILPRYGNVIATIVDFGLVFIIALAGSAFILGNVERLGWAALTPAIVIALSEVFFHKYLRKQFFEDAYPKIDATYARFDGTEQVDRDRLAYLQTEFSNEFDIGNPDGTDENSETEGEKNVKKYVPHKRRKRNKKRPY